VNCFSPDLLDIHPKKWREEWYSGARSEEALSSKKEYNKILAIDACFSSFLIIFTAYETAGQNCTRGWWGDQTLY
jgi:hypothetical protein